LERSIKGIGVSLSSPRLVIPAAIYGLWVLSHQYIADDFFDFQVNFRNMLLRFSSEVKKHWLWYLVSDNKYIFVQSRLCQPFLGCLSTRLLFLCKCIETMKTYNLYFQKIRKAQVIEIQQLYLICRRCHEAEHTVKICKNPNLR